jgi:hypothetical protein
MVPVNYDKGRSHEPRPFFLPRETERKDETQYASARYAFPEARYDRARYAITDFVCALGSTLFAIFTGG